MQKYIKISVWILFLTCLLFAGEKRSSAVFLISCYLDDQLITFESIWEKMPATKDPQAYKVGWKTRKTLVNQADYGKQIEIPQDSTFKTFEAGKEFFLKKVERKLDEFKVELPLKQ